MSSNQDEPEIILPNSRRVVRRRPKRGVILFVVLAVLFLVMHNAVPLFTDWLWFGEVGQRVVFTTTIVAKTEMFFLFAALFFALFYGNVAIARRAAPEFASRLVLEQYGAEWGEIIKKSFGWVSLLVAAFLSLWAGRIAADNWTELLQFTHAVPFGVTDPVFHNDIAFYVFRTPLLRFVATFFQTSLLLTIAVVVALQTAGRAIDTMNGRPSISLSVRRQILALIAGLAAAQAFATWLDKLELLTADNGVFTGAGYADLHFRLLAYNCQIVVLVVTAIVCIAAIVRGAGFRGPAIGAAVWAAALAILGLAIPGVAQKLFVDPNQLSMEQQFIARNIKFTRLGFGLENVRRIDSFRADTSLTAAQLRENRDTLANARLWDHDKLDDVYDQTQTVKKFFQFKRFDVDGSKTSNVDVDRYPIGGVERQVMLAARELDPSSLPPEAHTWQNEHLGYTHGYGLVMSPVNEVVDGGPHYFIQGFPPEVAPDSAGLKVTQPDIYYGMLNSDYVLVDTNQREYDPTQETGGQSTTPAGYHGRGGIQIGDSEMRKLAFSLRFGDQNILLANNLKPDTRMLFRRDIRERLQAVAPFLQQDRDPYLVLTDEGKLLWVVDCYTTSDRFPYSTPQEIPVSNDDYVAPNYIRNSVKATVDAYDGTLALYLADPTDPIARTYASIFPGLLKPMASMPAGLRVHVRYPEDLFRLQRSVYALYHVDDPGVFYRKEDAWSVPTEPNGESNGASPAGMEPYYVTMRLPAGTDGPNVTEREEFLMMSPLAPLKQEDKNILGWMCARCDGDRYGELVLYRFPQEQSVEGPSQIVSLINSDPSISKELALLRTGGSNATLGNMIVLPLDKSLLYIAPLFVTATSASQLPQLRRVLVGIGQNVAMAPTLGEALEKLFAGYAAPQSSAPSGTAPATAPTAAGNPAVPPQVRGLIDEATSEYTDAQKRLKSGDFAGYGEATRKLESTINRLHSIANAPAAPAPRGTGGAR